jgi:hypothetical protein
MSSADGGHTEEGDSEAIVDNQEAIVDNQVESRFEAVVGGQRAELVYRIDGDRLTIVHTGVPEPLNGHGLGGRLVAAAVQKAADEGYTVVPVCSFAALWLDEHKDASRLAPIEWPTRP